MRDPTPSLRADQVDRLRPLWDFENVDATEARLRKQLEREETDSGRAEVLTQLARVHGLRDDFDGCERLLQEAESLSDAAIVRVRVDLERGRKLRSGGEGEAAAQRDLNDPGSPPSAVTSASATGQVGSRLPFSAAESTVRP